MSNLQIFLTILIIIIATQLTRWLPFLVFRKPDKLPPFIAYLTPRLPLATLSILVVYCLKDLSLSLPRSLLNNTAAILLIVGLHLWKRQVLLSLLGGTLLYIMLVNLL